MCNKSETRCRGFRSAISLFFLLGLALGTKAHAADPGLVAWWKLDETEGKVAHDSSSFGNHGALLGDVKWVAGKLGGAWSADGNGDCIEVPESDSLALSEAVTVSMWVYEVKYSSAQQLIERGGTSGQAWGNAYAVRCNNGQINFHAHTGNLGVPLNSNGKVLLNDWMHLAVTFDLHAEGNNQKIYFNGVVDAENRNDVALTVFKSPLLLGADAYGTRRYWWNGLIDDVHIYSVALTEAQIRTLMANGFLASPVRSSDPNPADGATDVPRETSLGWVEGQYAQGHDVYLGKNLADVNNAGRVTPLNVLVSQGQNTATYAPSRLDFGQTYYWRVDEVNAPPDSTIFKGEVWSFTTEPYSYPIPGIQIKATASSQAPNAGPEKTIDGSGLNANGQHATDAPTMWSSAGVLPNWIQYEFDKTYVLDKLRVWNSNLSLEPILKMGAKEVTIEYSADGQTWTQLGAAREFAQAPGLATYTANTTIDFGGVMAQYVKLTINSTWGGTPLAGLSEVQFLYVPLRPWAPQPASGTVEVPVQTSLSWRAGREAASHQVFLGTDPNQLTVTATVQKPTYPTELSLGQTYYWKIVEVNQAKNPTSWASDVWSFSTQKFLVVDDFESYTDEDGKAIWQTWIDGYEVAANGSQVGNANPPYAERTIILGGKQAMPLFYSNTAGATYSEAERTFATAQDWTKYGCKTLALSFYGDPNCTGQLYLKINSTKILYSGKAEDLKRNQWQPWNIDLAASGANLKSVTKLAIGIDGAGAAGVLRFDNIRLYPTAGTTVTPVTPSVTGLVAWYKFDGDFKDSAGTYTAAAKGDAKIVNDPVRGQVVSLDGTGDGVAVPLLGSGSTQTVAMWANTAVDPVPLQFESFFAANGWEAKDLHWRYSYGKVNAGINGITGGPTGVSNAKPNQWNHVAVTVSATEFALWLNGLKEASMALAIPTTVTLGDGMIGVWLGTDGTTFSRGFTGTIDDVRFYNRALSPGEIGSLAGRTAPFAQPF